MKKEIIQIITTFLVNLGMIWFIGGTVTIFFLLIEADLLLTRLVVHCVVAATTLLVLFLIEDLKDIYNINSIRKKLISERLVLDPLILVLEKDLIPEDHPLDWGSLEEILLPYKI